MMGSRFGHCFVVSTYGESHGPAMGCVIDGCPPGIPIEASMIQAALDKRRPGQTQQVSPRNELDTVVIESGVFEGKTTGTPIALRIMNQDMRPKDYQAVAKAYRPGHGDFAYQQKYGIRDPFGGGRASARETVARVAAGAVALAVLKAHTQINVTAFVSQIGTEKAKFDLSQISANDIAIQSLNLPVPSDSQRFIDYLDCIQQKQDSVGAEITCLVTGMPAGLGEPVFDKLDARLAAAIMSINAVKGVAIGDGFDAVSMKGSDSRDALTANGFASNHAGGTLAGISTGQPLLLKAAFKATSSIPKPIDSLTVEGQHTTVEVTGRHDPCVAIRAVPIVEAMVALTLVDFYLLQATKLRED